MRESDIIRCRVQVLSTERGRPCGWGAVISSRQILTCTHVVEEALSTPVNDWTPLHKIAVLFSGIGGTGPVWLDITDIRHPKGPDTKASNDICILELAQGSFPADFAMAKPFDEEVPLGTSVFGYGLKEEVRDGMVEGGQESRRIVVHPIVGKRLHAQNPHRIPFIAEGVDPIVRPGSSGTPLFVENKGMIGIVVAAQAQQTAFYIPVKTLSQFVDFEARRRVSANVERRRDTKDIDEQSLHVKLYNNLHRLDRVDQWEMLEPRFEDSTQARKAFVCVIAGAIDDIPVKCQTKIVEAIAKPHARPKVAQPKQSGAKHQKPVSRPKPANTKLVPRRLAWPKARHANVDTALLELVRGLHPTLGRIQPPFDMDKIRKTLNAGSLPHFRSTIVDVAFFDRSHLQLLERWLDFLDDLNAVPLKHQLVDFLIFEFGKDALRHDDYGKATRQVDDHLNQLLGTGPRGFFGRLLRPSAATAGALLNRDAFLRLPALDMIRNEDIEDWIDEIAGSQSHDQSMTLFRIKRHYGEEFATAEKVRLKRIALRARDIDAYRGGSQ